MKSNLYNNKFPVANDFKPPSTFNQRSVQSGTCPFVFVAITLDPDVRINEITVGPVSNVLPVVISILSVVGAAT